MNRERWQQIEGLLDAALDRPRDERDAFLRDACGTDVDLKREVEEILDLTEEDGLLLGASVEHAAPDLLGELDDSVQGRAAETVVGQKIGPFRVVERIGEGGMGQVLLAERADDEFEQRVAIKVVSGGALAGDELRRRLAKERRILARLEHPHVARLIDGGITDDGVPWLAMEFVEGEPIDRFCDQLRLGLSERVRLFLDVCAAVEYAHRNLVVHRDLKPSNILVQPDSVNGSGRVKLLDFGIAKLLDPREEGAGLTRTGRMPFTPESAAPEQLRGEPITTGTDVYSLGVLLYRLLTGRPPMELEGLSWPELLKRLEAEEPKRASEVALDTKLRAALRGDLDNILRRALAREPERRYASVAALAEDLRRQQRGLPVSATSSDTAYRVRKFAGRHRVAVGFAASVLAVILTLAGSMTYQARRIANERDRANEEAAVARTALDFLSDVFRVSDPSAAKGDNITARQLLDTGLEKVGKLNGQPLVQARLMDTIGRVYWSLGLYGQAIPVLERALEIRRRELPADHSDLLPSLQHLADAYASTNDYSRAEGLYEQLLELREQQLGPDHELFADTLTDLANIHFRRGEYEGARQQLERAVSIVESLEWTSPTLGDAVGLLGAVQYTLGDFAAAEQSFRRVVETRKALDQGPDLAMAVALNNLALSLKDQGELDEARDLLEQVLGIQEELLDPNHPNLAVALNNLADLENAADRPEKALPLIERAVTVREAAMGSKDPELARFLTNLGWVLRRLDRPEEARPHLERGLDIRVEILGPEHLDTAWSLYHLGLLENDLALYERAIPLLRRSIAIFEKSSPDSPYLADVRQALDTALVAAGHGSFGVGNESGS